MRPSTRVWDVWLVAVLGSFGVLEVAAFKSGRFPTLSRVLRAHMGIAPPSRHGRVAPLLFLMFWLWLTGHLTEVQIKRLIRRSPDLSRLAVLLASR